MKSVSKILWGLTFGILSHGAYASLLGITFESHQLIAINQGNATSSLLGTVAGTLGSELAGFGGKIYAFDQTGVGTFRQINPADASTVASTSAGFSIGGEGGMSFRSDGVLFLSNSQGASGQLVECTNVTQNNTCALAAALAIAMDGLAFGSGDVLYGLSQSPVGTGQPSLFTIALNGTETLIGPTGVSGVNLAGLTFAPNGILYAAIDSSLYTINTITGVATLVGNTGFSQYAGLTAGAAVPEPATLALLGLGLAGLGFSRRKQ